MCDCNTLGSACGLHTPYDQTYMSFGGGVQSTALAYLAMERHPELMRVVRSLPTHFLFADTGDEPRAVYEHVQKIKALLRANGLQFRTVRNKKRLSDSIRAGRLEIPLWVESSTKSRAPLRRACTANWKVQPLDASARAIFRPKASKPLGQWLGISVDEAQRVRISQEPWRHFIYPLILMGWSRKDCVSYLASKGVEAPKSACTFCPFRSNELWKSLPDDEINFVIELEDLIQKHHREGTGYFGRLRSIPSFHVSGIPIREKPWLSGDTSFNEECEGMCGV